MSLQKAFATPWKVKTELRRLALLPFAHLYLRWHAVSWPPGLKLFGLPLIQKHRGSIIEIGAGTQMRNWFGSNPLGVNHPTILATWLRGAEITIGEGVGFTGTTIVCATAVTIGDRVFVGANSTITDTDFHPLDPQVRATDPQLGQTKPVVIENDVFIGMNVLILKGSHIGAGTVIGAGSVVSGKIPSGMIVAGNPAKVIRPVSGATKSK